MPPSVTRLDIEEEVVRIFSQMDESVRLDPVLLNGTISAVGTITAPSLDRGTVHANRYDGRLIKVAEDATAVAFSVAVTVTGVHSATTTTLVVSSTAEIRAGDVLEIGTTLEKVLVRAVVNATTLTVTRGWQGTTATATTGGETVRYDPFGVVTGVDDSGFAAGGVLTISPNFAVAGYGAGNFLLYPKGLSPVYVVARLNSVLRNTEHLALWFPSLVTDSDFESAAITNWPAVGSPTTRQFSTSNPDFALFGERYIQIVTDAVSEGVESTVFRVVEDEQLLVSTHVVSQSQDDLLDVRLMTGDTTANILLQAATEIGHTVLQEARFRQAVPAGHNFAGLEYLSSTTQVGNGTYNIASPVIVQSDRRRYYTTPSWLTRENQVRQAIAMVQGYNSDVADAYMGLSLRVEAAHGIDWLRTDRALVPLRVGLSNPGNDPIGFEVMRPFAELGGDSSTTVCDREYAALKTVSNILRDRRNDAWKHYAARAAKRARIVGYGTRDLSIEEQPTYVGV